MYGFRTGVTENNAHSKFIKYLRAQIKPDQTPPDGEYGDDPALNNETKFASLFADLDDGNQ